MNRIIYCVVVAIMATLAFSGCRSTKQTDGYVSTVAMETTSLGSQGDGNIVVRAWGSGPDKASAIDQAKRNALRAVLFTGISKGTSLGTLGRALVPEVNAEERYANYFEPFFSNGGEYLKFVSEEKGDGTQFKSIGESRKGYGVVLVIDRSALRRQLVDDGVLSR